MQQYHNNILAITSNTLSFLVIKSPPEQQQEWSLCGEDALDKAVQWSMWGQMGWQGVSSRNPRRHPNLNLLIIYLCGSSIKFFGRGHGWLQVSETTEKWPWMREKYVQILAGLWYSLY